MFIEHKVFIGLRDILNGKVTNTALLAYLEDAGGIHSNLACLGMKDIPKTKKSWVLLDWKIKLNKRPEYADTITIRTWSRSMDKLYAYRDFEILDEAGNILGIATSRWVLCDVEAHRILRLTEDIGKGYGLEDVSVFEDGKFEKLNEPKLYENSTKFLINRNLIDINTHVHNIYYIDIANEVLPLEVYKNIEFNNIRVMYKKEIKYGENVNVYLHKENEKYIIVIKSEDNKDLHAIVNLS